MIGKRSRDRCRHRNVPGNVSASALCPYADVRRAAIVDLPLRHDGFQLRFDRLERGIEALGKGFDRCEIASAIADTSCTFLDSLGELGKFDRADLAA